MIKFILALLFALTLFQSCNKGDERVPICENCTFTCLDMNETDVLTNDCLNEWVCSFQVTPDSKVALSELQGLANGDKNVFQMIRRTEGDLALADDEYTHILVFGLDESQNSFSVQDNELSAMKVHYRIGCFCDETEFKEVTSGCIQGEKQSDGIWIVQGNINVPYTFGDVEVKFEAQFMN
jgi:hypothetical protein